MGLDAVTRHNPNSAALWEQAAQAMHIDSQAAPTSATTQTVTPPFAHDTQSAHAQDVVRNKELLTNFFNPYLPTTTRASNATQGLQPPLDPPVTQTMAKRHQTLNELHELFSNGQIDIDNLLPLILLHLYHSQAGKLSIHKQLILAEEKWANIQENAKHQLATQEIAAAGRAKTGKTVLNATASFGFAAAAVGTVCTAPTPFAFIGAGLGALLVIDTLCDDAGKKQIANWIARGDKEAELAWLGRIHLFTNVASFALSFGLNPTKAIEIGAKVAQATAKAVSETLDSKLSDLNAELMQINELCERSEREQENFSQRVTEISKFIFYIYDMLKHVSDNQNRTMKAIQRI